MESGIQVKIAEYIEVYESVLSKVGEKDVAAIIVEQIGKDSRVEAMHKESQAAFRGNGKQIANQPASQKQRAYLRRLGVSIRNGQDLTKAQASQLIDEALDNNVQ